MPCDEHLCRERVVAYRVMGVYSEVTRIEPEHGYGIDASVDGQCTCTLACLSNMCGVCGGRRRLLYCPVGAVGAVGGSGTLLYGYDSYFCVFVFLCLYIEYTKQ